MILAFMVIEVSLKGWRVQVRQTSCHWGARLTSTLERTTVGNSAKGASSPRKGPCPP